MKTVFIIAGEASGDLHGRNLIRALRDKNPGIRIHSVGGPLMASEQPLSHIELSHLAVTGFVGIISQLPAFLKFFQMILNKIKVIGPDGIVMIDNPGFNLRLAKRLGESEIPMVYYICPQVWAWAENRVLMMKHLFKKALVVFEFEKDIYLKYAMPVEWVGHPLKDIWQIDQNSNGPKRDTGGRKRIILMPGSRQSEIEYLLPIFIKSAEIIRSEVPDVTFELIRAETIAPRSVNKFLSRSSIPISLIEKDGKSSLRHAALGLICSGTATLECALAGLPMIIAYRSNALTAFIARRLIKCHALGLPNILAKKTITPEFLQEDATPERIASEAVLILKNPGRADEIRKQLLASSSRLGDGHASERAAEEILKIF